MKPKWKNESAHPVKWEEEYGDNGRKIEYLHLGFSKLELGTFMIAQGLVSKYDMKKSEDQLVIAMLSKEIAETILEHLEQ